MRNGGEVRVCVKQIFTKVIILRDVFINYKLSIRGVECVQCSPQTSRNETKRSDAWSKLIIAPYVPNYTYKYIV